jgi:hypothetical protein
VQCVDNLAAIEVVLTDAQRQALDSASAIDLGFPHDVVANTAARLAGAKLDQIDWPGSPVR